jgi:pyruvate/2-oxoglutarate dehydrogenase complex dihydrolipoamide dehydrogenase (E3) component
MNRRIGELAQEQSHDIGNRLRREGVTVLAGSGRFASVQPGRAFRVEVTDAAGAVTETIEADVVLLSTGRRPGCSRPACPTVRGSCRGAISTR